MKPKCTQCGAPLIGKDVVFGLCAPCLEEVMGCDMEYKAEMVAAARRKADEVRRVRTEGGLMVRFYSKEAE